MTTSDVAIAPGGTEGGAGGGVAELPGKRLLAIRGARILPSPDAPPIDRGNVLLRGDRIVRLGPDFPIPSAARVVPAEGRVVTAGFWNAHVHFTEPKWRGVRRKRADVLEAQLHDMLTSRGFTTVVDLGSDPRVTLPLRQRIESDGLLGPAIYTSGPGVYPPRGLPYYLRDSIPFWLRPLVPQPSSPWRARRVTERNLARGADVVKLFTGSYVERGKVAVMPEAIARAAADAGHADGKIALSHPSNLEGTRVALRAGVDVLAHPPDMTDGVDATLLKEIVERRMAMIPTLKMFATTVTRQSDYLDPIYDVVRRFRGLGGELLFGTDVGYMTDYATEDEFRALGECGLDWRAVLRMLTVSPAQRFGVGNEVGVIAPGRRADLTILDADPADHLLAFTRVHGTVRAGRVLHLRK